jgi:hypothetical protein
MRAEKSVSIGETSDAENARPWRQRCGELRILNKQERCERNLQNGKESAIRDMKHVAKS